MSQSEPHVCTAGSNLLEVFEHDCTHEIAIIALFTGPLSAFHRLQYIESLEMSTANLYTIRMYQCNVVTASSFFHQSKNIGSTDVLTAIQLSSSVYKTLKLESQLKYCYMGK